MGDIPANATFSGHGVYVTGDGLTTIPEGSHDLQTPIYSGDARLAPGLPLSFSILALAPGPELVFLAAANRLECQIAAPPYHV